MEVSVVPLLRNKGLNLSHRLVIIEVGTEVHSQFVAQPLAVSVAELFAAAEVERGSSPLESLDGELRILALVRLDGVHFVGLRLLFGRKPDVDIL